MFCDRMFFYRYELLTMLYQNSINTEVYGNETEIQRKL